MQVGWLQAWLSTIVEKSTICLYVLRSYSCTGARLEDDHSPAALERKRTNGSHAKEGEKVLIISYLYWTGSRHPFYCVDPANDRKLHSFAPSQQIYRMNLWRDPFFLKEQMSIFFVDGSLHKLSRYQSISECNKALISWANEVIRCDQDR